MRTKTKPKTFLVTTFVILLLGCEQGDDGCRDITIERESWDGRTTYVFDVTVCPDD